MFSFIKQLFSKSNKLQEFLAHKPLIIDVRTKEEFTGGHIPKSINIPLDNFSNASKKLKSNDYIIICCRSGTRSTMALGILKSKGFTHLLNGGGWQSLHSKIKGAQ
jgi:rhodanese-related sulfurtransferase